MLLQIQQHDCYLSRTLMHPDPIGFIVALLIFAALAVWFWQQARARKRFAATIMRLSRSGCDMVGGKPVDYWLDVLNQDTTQPIYAISTTVLMYREHDFFFVDGQLMCWTGGKGCACQMTPGFFLVAVGQSAVSLLAEQEHIFRHITGSTELAIFSVYQWARFARSLKKDFKRQP
ncbi:MAG: hypothetical protein JW818_14425 [Pirellulales bacterium]|nr:hypothetical protein [Pirellulales bacterium]